MPKKLFDGTLITTPNEPDDDDRVAFDQPGTAGSKNMLWSYFKVVVKAFTSLFEWVDFTPQAVPPAYQIGRIFYDQTENTHTAFNDIEGISLQIGEELRARLVNDLGFTGLNGKAVAVTGAIGASLKIELLDVNNLNSSIRGFGLLTHDIINGQPGYAVRYGAVRELNTSTLTPGDIVWGKPDFPGDWTNIRPVAPNYPVRIGVCLISHATLGVIGVDTLAFNGTDTGINIEGTLNGMATQTPDVDFSVSGGVIYADVTNEAFPTKNLPFMLGGVRYLLDTTTVPITGSAQIAVPPGASDILKQKSYIHVILNGGVPELAVSTSRPSVPHAMICDVTAYNAVRTLADGKVFAYRRQNNASNSETEGIAGTYGFTRVLSDDARSRGSAWDSGQVGTDTVSDITIKLALSAGVGKQLHYSNTPLFDGNSYQIYNTSTNAITYADETDLINIVLDSAGNTLLGNGFYYTFRFYYKLNSNGIGNDIVVTRPGGHYSSGEFAEADSFKYTTVLADSDIEDIVYPLYDMIIGRTGGGGTTVTLFKLISLRSKTPGVAGGTGGEPAGTDDKIRTSAADTTNSYLDDKLTVGAEFTKEIVNPAGNENLLIKFKGWIYNAARTFKTIISSASITADRTATMPDISGLMAIAGMVNAFVFGGQAHGGNALHTFSASKTFDMNDGNIQEMPVSASTTIAVSNLLVGTNILQLPITVGTSPVITIGASLGTKYTNSEDLVNADGDENTITIVKFPSGSVRYTITTLIA